MQCAGYFKETASSSMYFPIRNKIILNKKQVMKAKLLFCSKRGGTKFLISFQDRLYLMIANSRVEYKLT